MQVLRAGRLAVLLGSVCPVPAFAELVRPAEVPPADYAGQQYVDSKGCMFVRAGSGGEVVWVPRVSREGAPICSNPPSGGRVPVDEEVGATTYSATVAATSAGQTVAAGDAAAPDDAVVSVAPGGFFVAVGSFGMAANAGRAEARLKSLGYPVVRGRLQGGSSTLITVFAGPFADATAAGEARMALRANGFPDAVLIGP